MSNILTITLNPALDLSTFSPAALTGGKLRCAPPQIDAGGGGVNVARAIAILGGDVRAFVALAGHTGARLRGALQAAGVEAVVFELPGETRQSLAVTDRGTGEQARFVFPGPEWDAGLVAAALAMIDAAVPQGGYVVLSGSHPPGVPDDFPTILAAALIPKSARLILDTSGAPLLALAEGTATPPYVLRIDDAEAEALAGRALPSRADVAGFAAALVARGVARNVVLAMGPEGSVLATPDGLWHSNTDQVPVRSKVGAGDSFVGAFTLALSRGETLEAALVQGCAAASAAVMTEATALCDAADVQRLAATATLTRL